MLDTRDNVSPKQKKVRRILLACAVVLCLLIELLGRVPGLPFNGWSDVFAWARMPQAHVIETGELQVHFIDVGNADCILVRQGDHNLLIDAGEVYHGDVLLDYFNRHGVDHLDMVIATHPHSDHIGAISTVLEETPAECFVWSRMPEGEDPTAWYFTRMFELLDAYDAQVDEARAGAVYELGDAQIQILSPSSQEFEVDEANDISIVARLTYGEHAFLFTGDADIDVEARLLEDGYVLEADVLKVAHHGSKTSTSPAFLKAVSPQYAVISCGTNDYNHPSSEIVSRLWEAGAKIYRTDEHGDIVFVSDGSSLSVRMEKVR